MSKTILYFLLCVSVLLNISCAKSYQLTPEREYRLVVKNCESEADSIRPRPARGAMDWAIVYENCMQNSGYASYASPK